MQSFANILLENLETPKLAIFVKLEILETHTRTSTVGIL